MSTKHDNKADVFHVSVGKYMTRSKLSIETASPIGRDRQTDRKEEIYVPKIFPENGQILEYGSDVS